MKAFSWGRCSSVMISAPGASQSMSASAHWRSLIFASIDVHVDGHEILLECGRERAVS